MIDELPTVVNSSECLYRLEEVEEALTLMARRLDARLEGTDPVFLAVMVGAMIPAGFLLSRMRVPLHVSYIHATRYQGATEGGSLEWRATPNVTLKDRTVVIFDDILDLGVTLQAIVDYCLAQGAKEVLTAVLVNKRVERHPQGVKKRRFRRARSRKRLCFLATVLIITNIFAICPVFFA